MIWPYSFALRYRVHPPDGFELRDLPEPESHRFGDMVLSWTFREAEDGTIEADLDFALADGVWSGDITIPAQGARDIALEEFTVEDGKAVFSIQGIPGEPTFHGQFSEQLSG